MTQAGATLAAPPLGVRSVLVDSVRRRRSSFRRLAAWSVLEALPALLSGLLVASAVNSFVAGKTATGLGWLVVFAVSVAVGAWGTRRSLGLLASVVEPFRDELVTGVVTGAMRRSTISGRSPHTSDVATLSEQVEMVREAYAAVLMVVQQFTVVSLAALVGLSTLSPVVVLLVAPPLVVAVAMFVFAVHRMAGWQRESIVSDERFARDASALASGLRDVAASGGEERVTSTIGEHIDAHARATRALGRFAAVGTLAIAVGSWLPLLLLLGFGSRLVAGGASAGVLVGAATYILAGLQPALQTLVHGLSGPGLWLIVTLRRVVDTMETPPMAAAEAGRASAHPSAVEQPSGQALQVASVTFAYSDWAVPVVAALNLTVPADDHLVVVGPSGVGKSTLAGLMAGLLRPGSGAVWLGATDVADLTAAELASYRVVVPQESYVFGGTIRDNLTYLRREVPPVELDAAVAAVGASALVQGLGGYDAVIDQTRLSGGEGQLITLVRAYLSPASLVILDEATCFLDPAAEAQVEHAFAARPGALVIVAHRMSSALRARRVLVMDGASVDVGSHDELLATSSLYRDLVGHWQSGVRG